MQPFHLRGRGSYIEVAGTRYRRHEMKEVLSVTDPSESYRESASVFLVPEPDNPHDAHAISVRVGSTCIGYIPADELETWWPIVARFVASGYIPQVDCNLRWSPAYLDHIDEGGFAGADLYLPEPEQVFALNDAPAESSLLPDGGSAQVVKEEDHFDVLFNYVPRSGEGRLYLEFRLGARTLKNGQERTIVYVYLDGEHVGELSSVTGQKFEAALRHAEDMGKRVVVWGTIKGSALSASLTFKAAKSDELPDEWVRDLPSAPILIPDSGVRLEALPRAYKPSWLDLHPAPPKPQSPAAKSAAKSGGCAVLIGAGLGLAGAAAALGSSIIHFA
ncbi:HIRAN domain-containing protein [Brevibacterium sp. 91QC2O2]|uniref:HIRAN domain-containing protein n=1 Tax=Brevibacterium sp. 91QC2O2 TaxID=2968458 RepID=UPI00211CA765|nr:HIRAN domain-containing protein [Brevibacterium sp. 91QC2O2]MCQ9367982.1 HIRAN domain-containing protein [Brevibacterium sp. 91QC2O2]